MTIKRQWNSEGKSTWTLNTCKAPESAIVEALLRMNSRVGNLLQFLPQEKVSEFNSMSDTMRLKCFQEGKLTFSYFVVSYQATQ